MHEFVFHLRKWNCFRSTVCKTLRPTLSDRCLSCLSCLSVTLVYCGQTVGWIKMPHGMKVGLGLGHIVLDGDSAPPPKAQPLPQVSAHVCCCQTAEWIKMPLAKEVGLGAGYIVLDGDPAPLPPKKGTQAPTFWPMSVVAKRLDGSRCHLVRRQALAQATLC